MPVTSELKLALRRLRQAPLFTAFAIVTMALAIGITTAVYSLVRAGLQAELGLDDADRLMLVGSTASLSRVPGATPVSWLDYQDFIAQATVLERVAAWSRFEGSLVTRGRSELARGEAVSGAYFATVGLSSLRGRLLAASDDVAGATPVAVLSEAAWRIRFDRDPTAIGVLIKVNGVAFQVVGIAPAAFRGVDRPDGFARPEIWITLAGWAQVNPSATYQNPLRRHHAWLSVVGRLGPGQNKAAAAAEFDVIAKRIDAATPLPDIAQRNGTFRKQPRTWTAVGATERISLTDARDAFRIVLLLPALVLLVACTNLANFALSRGVARQNEFSVCRALGASRWQLIRGQLIEHAIVAAAGSAGAVLVANRLLVLVAGTVASLAGTQPQFRVDPYVDGHILAAAGVAGLLSFFVAGLIPALQLTGKSLRSAMADDQTAASLPRWRGRSNLIALQVSVTVALLLVAALCVRQFPKLNDEAASGMSLDRVALVTVPFRQQSIGEVRARQIVDQLIDSLRALPVTSSAAAVSNRRFTDHLDVAAEGRELAEPGKPGPTLDVKSASPAYFETTGLALMTGRPFDHRDVAGGERVGIINASAAGQLFGTMEVTGRRLQARDYRGTVTIFTLVGVSADTRTPRGHVDNVMFVPFAQRFEDLPIEVLVRARDDGDPVALAATVRETLRRIEPDLAVGFVGRADAPDFGPGIALRYFVLIFGALAFLALAFAMSGLYGVLSHIVARRTQELGLRAALGAEPGQLLTLVFRDGSRPIVEGVIIGLAMAAGARMGMQSWFTEPVTAVDPLALIIALVPLLAAAALACYLPARRAARVDPNVALRHL